MRIPRIFVPILALVLTLFLGENKVVAQGTINIALTQQFSFVGCATAANACGQPLIGGLLYFYQVGTVATPQDSFQDTGLTIKNTWPLALDANGRVPMFYLASGSIHVRLTDAGGVVQFDYPSMLVIGPSGGGGGGGGAVDPTTVAATGDMKWRPTSETITGWVKANGLTIGNAASAATGLASNTLTQNLFVYLWTNCTQAHCPVRDSGGTIVSRGARAIDDFNGNRQITVYDMRGRGMFGLDDMGTTAAGRLVAGNITGGGDTTTTPAGIAGNNSSVLAQSNLPNLNLAVTSANVAFGTITTNLGFTDPGHSHNMGSGSVLVTAGGVGVTVPVTGGANYSPTPIVVNGTSISFSPSTTIGNSTVSGQTAATGGSSTGFTTVSNSLLGTWYLKL